MIVEYVTDKLITPNEIADLRQAVGWNRLEEELNRPDLADFLRIAVTTRKN